MAPLSDSSCFSLFYIEAERLFLFFFEILSNSSVHANINTGWIVLYFCTKELSNNLVSLGGGHSPSHSPLPKDPSRRSAPTQYTSKILLKFSEIKQLLLFERHFWGQLV